METGLMRQAFAGGACLDPGDLAMIKDQRIFGVPLASHLRDRADALERTALLVETKWDLMPVDIQEILKLAAYSSMTRPPLLRLLKRPLVVVKGLAAAVQLLLEGDSSIAVYSNAKRRYERAILGAIERSTDAYKTRLSDALTLPPSPTDEGISVEDYMKRLRGLSDSAV